MLAQALRRIPMTMLIRSPARLRCAQKPLTKRQRVETARLRGGAVGGVISVSLGCVEKTLRSVKRSVVKGEWITHQYSELG